VLITVWELAAAADGRKEERPILASSLAAAARMMSRPVKRRFTTANRVIFVTKIDKE
jgi:hypothetical protein